MGVCMGHIITGARESYFTFQQLTSMFLTAAIQHDRTLGNSV